MLLLDLFDTVYTCCMTSACEFFLEESIDHAQSYAKSYNALAECQDLGIVMLKLFVFYLLSA